MPPVRLVTISLPLSALCASNGDTAPKGDRVKVNKIRRERFLDDLDRIEFP